MQHSTCANHTAVNNDVTNTRGLSETGAGAVSCARHEFILPCGVCDLQKGERYVRKFSVLIFLTTHIRYANMDYIFFSCLRGNKVISLVLSYDVVCQWFKHIWKRMKQFPRSWHVDPNGKIFVTFLIPKFHLPAHIPYCHNTFSYNLTKNVGRTDGEAPERGWGDVDPLAPSTREMGPGSRRDTLDDNLGDRNFKKCTRMGVSLLRKLKVAVDESAAHTTAHDLLTITVPPAVRPEWTAAIEAWEEDSTSRPNPYQVQVSGMYLVLIHQPFNLTVQTGSSHSTCNP
jgi:hypothetical protein